MLRFDELLLGRALVVPAVLGRALVVPEVLGRALVVPALGRTVLVLAGRELIVGRLEVVGRAVAVVEGRVVAVVEGRTETPVLLFLLAPL